MTSEEPKNEDPIDAAMEASLKDMPREPRRKRRDAGPEVTKGTIVQVSEKDVLVELSPTRQGLAPLTEFASTPEPGQIYDFVVGEEKEGLVELRRSENLVTQSLNEITPGSQVTAKVVGANTGGLELKVGKLAAFMPYSHIALERVEDVSKYIGQNIVAEVLEVDRGKKRVLLSRRAILQRERDSKRSEAVSGIRPGMVLKGTIKRFESFGAFVEIKDGVEGLLHVSNISHRRVDKPGDILTIGQQVEVAILEIKEGGRRIGLGMKQLERDPWDDAAMRFRPNEVHKGRVTRGTNFGAFVELEPGLEGLVHISQLSNDRIRRVQDAVKPGDQIDVRVLSINMDEKKLSLSRLDQKGRLIGAVEEAEEKLVEEVVKPTQDDRRGTNLGDLLNKALNK